MREQLAKKINLANEWFAGLSDDKKQEVFQKLLEIAIEQDYINVWTIEDRNELSAETGQPLETFVAPYFTSCGEPIL